MRYNVTFNQLELMEYNERHTEKKIDIKDAIILQQLWHLSKWEGVEVIETDNGQYFWAAYGKIMKELPTLGFRSNDSLSKRIRNKLLKNDLLRLHVNWNDNSKTFWRFTEAGLKIATPGRMDVTPRTNGRNTPGRTDVTPPDERTDNYNTNHYRTKDEREALTHFDFIKKCLTNDYEEWKKETKNKVYNGKKFIESFNNDMQLEGFPKSEKLIYRLAKYSRHWIERQTEKDKPEPKPPYSKRIVT